MAVQAMTRYFLLLVLGFFSREQRVDADVIVGLIDEDYRGNAGVIVKSNFKSFVRRAIIPKGTRIAQMRIVRVPETELKDVVRLDMTKNRGGGYGHTGEK
jgi:dUTPase